ncbi:MAG: hypothetical protein RSE13_09750 [Planktothrix sp. GU0601_MAG3]|nr:MAG: hypothetical protein RSE13_09750 [Planktothrix sp. GU0601_MAG3]
MASNEKSIGFDGDVDISQLVKAIAGDENLPVPPLNLKDPELIYSTTDGKTQYSFKSGSLTVKYIKDKETYSFIAEKIPVGNLLSWIETELKASNLGSFITGGVNVKIASNEKSITFDGDVDISQLVKASANNNTLPIPSLNLKDPELIYSTTDGKTQYSFKSGGLTVKYIKDKETYSFIAEKIPVGNLLSWIETELKASNLGSFITGDVNVKIASNEKSITFDGDVDISQLVKAIANDNTLPIPSLNLKNPELIYNTDKDGKTQYSFRSGNFKIEYGTNADETYKFSNTGIPVGELTDWLATELGNESIKNFITGNVNIEVTPTQKFVSFTESVNISELIKAIAGNQNLPIPSLKLEKPELSYSTTDGKTQYSFNSNTFNVKYSTDDKGSYNFSVGKIPVGELTNWLTTELGINSINDFITGNVNIEVTPTQKSVSFAESVDISALVKAIAGDPKLPIPFLKLEKPKLIYSTTDGKTQYSFKSDSLNVNYIKDKETYEFSAEKIPVGNITSWLQSALGLNPDLKIIQGTVDIGVSPEEKKLSLTGNISFTDLANMVNITIPEDLKNLAIKDPIITVGGTAEKRSYEFSGTGAVTLGKDTFGDFTSVAKLLPGISADATGITLSGKLEVSQSAAGVLSLQGVFPALGAIKLSREDNKWKLVAIDDGDRLTLADLAIVATDKEYSFTDLLSYEFKGEANLGIKAETSIEGNAAFPSFSFDTAAKLELFNYGDQAQASKEGLNISFNNLTLDAGTFVTDFTQPVISLVDNIIDPIKPVVKALNTDTKLFSYIGLEKAFDYDKKNGVSLLDIAGSLAQFPAIKAKNPGVAQKVETAVKFSQAVSDIVELVDTLNQTSKDESFKINLGSFNLNSFKAASKDKADSASAAPVPNPTRSRDGNSTDTKLPADNFFTKVINKLNSIEGLEIPLLTQPKNAFKLVLGQTADLIKYDIPDLEFGFGFEKSFPIYSPPNINGILGASFDAKTDLAVGFDTYGLNQWKATDYKLADSYKVLDGFYLDDWSKDGRDKDELTIKAGITAGLALDVLVAEAALKGGLEGRVGFDLEDIGEKNGTSDGKVRGSEILSRLNRPLSLFETDGNFRSLP